MFWAGSSTAQNHIIIDQAIQAQVNQHNQTYFTHEIKQGETLYSLAKYFKIALTDLLLVNKMKSGHTLSTGSIVIIPLAVEHIKNTAYKKYDTWTPIYYEVKKQETLYRISKVYFPQKLEDLIKRNNTRSFAVKPGEQLLIGWWAPPQGDQDISDLTRRIKQRLKERLQQNGPPINDSSQEPTIGVDSINTNTETDVISELDDILSEIEEISEDPDSTDTQVTEFNYKKGIAYWDKDGHDRENLFVMHSKAKANSFISLRYPVTGREVTAQVISPIPSNLYAADVDIVITPAVAQALGALDSRFEIQMDYYE